MLVCLDVDGCLIDSDVPMLMALNEALDAHGLEPVTMTELRAVLGPPLVVTMEKLLQQRGRSRNGAEQLARRYRDAYAPVSVEHAVAYPGVADVVDVLWWEGHCLVVVSSKPARYSRPVLAAAGLLDHFADVHGPIGVEREQKSRTLARALAAGRSGRTPAVHVGDTVQDVEAARTVGILSVAVTWGYGDTAALGRARPRSAGRGRHGACGVARAAPGTRRRGGSGAGRRLTPARVRSSRPPRGGGAAWRSGSSTPTSSSTTTTCTSTPTS